MSGGIPLHFGARVFNVKDFGAVGDGLAHPLSAFFLSIGAAQIVYPRATALTESIEWHAHQLAIDMATTAGGGIIYSPAGTYIMSASTATAPDSLKFPLRIDNATTAPGVNNAQVHWMGDGDIITQLQWTADMGSSPGTAYAVMCGQQAGDPGGQQADSRYAKGNGATSAAWFRDLCLIGPAVSNTTIGATGCNVSGICWAAHRMLTNVRISGFYAGLDIVGDHTAFRHVLVDHCYYGWYINHNSPSLYGDLATDGKCSIGTCRMACVGFAYGGSMGTWQISGRMFMGTSPFAFFKEATPASPPAKPVPAPAFLAGIEFDALFIEDLGNAFIWDDNQRVNGNTNATVLDRCVFRNLTLPGWNDALRLPNYDRCHILIGNMNGCRFENVTKLEATGCTRPLIDVQGSMYGESVLTGDIEAIIASCNAVGGQGIYSAVTVASGGSNYAVGDLIVLAGGTLVGTANAAILRVATVTGTAVATVTIWGTGLYSTLPTTATQASTSGSGSGATFTIGATAGSTPLLFRAADVACKRMAVEHTHGDGSLGCYKGHVWATYNGHAVTAQQAVCNLFYGVQPATDTSVGAFIGLARTSCTFSGGNVIVAEEGDDIPYNATGTNTGQTLKKLTSTAGAVTDATGISDGRVVGFANFSSKMQLFKRRN
jgi:hypothetical protein